MSGDGEFALCLTHDVDRPFKTVQSLYYALADRDPSHLRSLLPGENPWWQFEAVMDLEASLGVRSAFYFLQEPPLYARSPRDWVDPHYLIEELGRYSIERPDVADAIRDLDRGGWEVGLHGSYDAFDDPDRLRTEKERLESVLGDEIRGGRQHHLNLGPDTWRHYAGIGLDYDASLGSSSAYGFHHGYDVLRPFDDEFVVFPLTIMEVALPDDMAAAWRECERLLAEASANDAVMTILWHPRMFDEDDFPGYRELYRRLIERARELGAWVGPPGEYYDRLDHPTGTRRPADKRSLPGTQAGDNKVPTGETEATRRS